MSLPPALTVYRGLTGLMAPLLPALLNHRAKQGKEDRARRNERLGQPTADRPAGPLVWLHGASVGESLVLATLIDGLSERHPELQFVITTGTLTSADLLSRRLSSNARHQFVPVDTVKAARGFLDHWQPDLAVFAESELWPNLITETALRGVPMALVNARMNDKSLKGWRGRPDSARWLLACFDWIGAADTRTQAGLEDLTGRVIDLAGNLKLEARPVQPDPHELARVKVNVTGRPVWLAASTHDGEDPTVLNAHDHLLKQNPHALLVLAPRHPDRGDALETLIKSRGYACARRSRMELPGSDHQVWLADTLGEMPLWFSVAPAALIGGSLARNIGGHNPIEASQAGAAVITGEHVASFQDLYDCYRNERAAVFVQDAHSISEAVACVWAGEGPSLKAAHAAIRAASGGALETTLDALTTLLSPALEPQETA